MPSRLAAVLMMLAVPCPWAMAGGKADNKASVSFHLETDANENPKMIFQQEVGGKPRFFRRMPEISIKDVVSFSPFPADTGDYGVVFRLKENAARRLSAITASNPERWMMAMINGRVVDGVLIDRQIDDGVLVAWKGVNLTDIELFDKELPRIGQEGGKKKKKPDDPP